MTKQRDHTAHTVNNWLLGWLLFENVPLLKSSIFKGIEVRGFELGKYGYKDSELFGDIWMDVSLLHDIGYMFEGSIQIANMAKNHEYIDFALNLIHDYFQHRFWKEVGIFNPASKDALLRSWVFDAVLCRLKIVNKCCGRMRNLGDLSNLENSINALSEGKKCKLKSDAFEL